MSFLKTVVGLGSIAAVSTTALFFTVGKGWGNSVPPQAYYVSLEKAGQSSEYQNKFGATYANYLLATKEGNNVEEWDRRASEIKKKEKLLDNSFFQNIKDNATGASLKTVCSTKYNETIQENQKTLWEEVWAFCSFFSEKPTNVKESEEMYNFYTDEVICLEDYSEGTHGKVSADKLVSVSPYTEEEFWDYQGYTHNRNIKEWCAEAYKENSTSSNYSKEDLYKYCTLEGKA